MTKSTVPFPYRTMEQQKRHEAKIKKYQLGCLSAGWSLEKIEQNIKDNYNVDCLLAMRENISSKRVLAQIKRELNPPETMAQFKERMKHCHVD